MDVYEFTQALRRQRRFLIVGAVLLLLATFLLTFKVSSAGLEPRIPPSYEATVRMVVTDGNVGTLATAPTGGDAMAQTAAFFQTLLMGPDALRAISESAGAPIEEFQATNSGAAITVRAVSSSPDGAMGVAVGSYDWLTQRLDKPLELVSVTPTTVPPSLLDDRGHMTVDVAVDVSPAFVADGEGLWVVLSVNGNQFKTFSLVDAALEDSAASSVAVLPGGELVLRLEDASRNALDEITLTIPELTGTDTEQHQLSVRMERGAVVGLQAATAEGDDDPAVVAANRDVSRAELVADRVGLSLDVVDSVESAPPTVPAIGLSLITEDPIPMLTGTRRGPILSMGALFGGTFALMVAAIAIDNWRQAHRVRAMSAYNDRLAIVRPIDGSGRYEGAGPLSHRLKRANDTDRGSGSEPGREPDTLSR